MLKDGNQQEFRKESLSGGKSMPSLIDPNFILGMGYVLADGAKKYSRENWQLCSEEQLYLYEDAAMRHLLAHMKGELCDPDTGLKHLYHAACNLMFLAWFEDNVIMKGDDNENK